jgi:hypothetical protein
MKIHVYKQGKVFLDAAQDYLEANEVMNNLILGLAFQIEQHPERFEQQPFLSMVKDDDQSIAAVGLMTPPYSLLVHSDLDDPTDALKELAAHLDQHQWNFPGVNGRKDVSTRFAELWSEQHGLTFHAEMKTRVYELLSVNHPEGIPGSMRLAVLDDVDLVSDWISAFHTESLPSDPPRDNRRNVEIRIRENMFYLWEDQGKIVSMAAKARPVRNGITVNAVYTPPEHRRKGYATILVAQLSQLLMDEGWKFCTLFTDLGNPTSNSIYQKVGYNPICDFRQYRFQNSDSDSL